MTFQSLSNRNVFKLDGFPDRWIPLIHLYDPDLPLFPIYYFHGLADEQRGRPSDRDRVYGYVEKINHIGGGTIEVTVVTNRDLESDSNGDYRNTVERLVKHRLGLSDPVTLEDVKQAFDEHHQLQNRVLEEIWYRVVSSNFGNKLPFGRLWDEAAGLARFVGSFNSPSGRKGELVQYHYFMTHFGVRIQSSGNLPNVDFYILPTIQEILDFNNPLSEFPMFSKLANLSNEFVTEYGSLREISGLNISVFNGVETGGKLTGKVLRSMFSEGRISREYMSSGIECFNAFDKGPQRTVIYILMLNDLRKHNISPDLLTEEQIGSIYEGLGRSYQAPKVIAIYAQQSFGNKKAIPVDNWVNTFLKYPLNLISESNRKEELSQALSFGKNMGKLERLIWITAQSRKVHSSACNDALWCLKYSGNREPRGSNPLSCKICLEGIRNVCPSYNSIKKMRVSFNEQTFLGDGFVIKTEERSDHRLYIKQSEGTGRKLGSFDDFSPVDMPDSFPPLESRTISRDISVEEFVRGQ